MNAKEIKALSKIKFNVYKLKTGGQIPSVLFTKICELDSCSTVGDVQFLMALTEQFLRIKGFYFKFPEVSQECEKAIQVYFEERSN